MAGKPTYDELVQRVKEFENEAFESKRAEEALKESEERFALAMRFANEGLYDWNLETNQIYYSPGWKLMLGYEDEEISNDFSEWERLTNPEDVKVSWVMLNDLLEGDRDHFENEFQMRHKDGHWVDILSRANVVFDENGKGVRVLGTHVDITELRQAEEALRESESLFSQMFEQSSTSTCLYNPDGTVNRVNNEFCKMFGVEEKGIMNAGYNVFKDQASIDAGLTPLLEHIFKEKKTEHWETIFDIDVASASTGTPTSRTGKIYIEVFGYPVLNREGNLEYVVLQHYDITRRKQAEEALSENEKKFRTLFDTSPHAIGLTEIKSGKLIDVNDKLCRLTKYAKDEILGRTVTELGFYSDVDRNRFISELNNSGKVDGLEMEFKRKDDGILNARMFAVPIQIEGESFILTEFHDITEEKRLEVQLQQAHKMEAISTLTGGIAHDYNNFMSIIMGNLSMAIEEVEPGSLLGDFLNEANTASCKVRDLTHELMALSRGGEPVKEVGSLKELLRSALDTITAHDTISAKESISQDLWPVAHDLYKMGAVFRNVLTNAVEAMPDGGTLKIKAENLAVKDEAQIPGLPVKSGDYVHISIQDDGMGIPEKHLPRIFDPYFSTKAMGTQKGMGLGLATADAIVKKHGGHIAIDTAPGVGTTVNIYLPAETQPEEIKSTITSTAEKASPVKRVLVMDDEEMLRDLAQMMLQRLGHEVETVKDGDEAIEAYKKQKDSGEPFDAAMLDLTIKGGMGGEQTIRKLLKIDPHIKAIVCSGYSNDPVLANYEEHGFRGAMAKPYQMADLEQVLEKVLG